MSIFDTEQVIAIEEHYIDPNITKLQEESTKNTKIRNPKMVARMEDFGGERIEEMDAAGIDVQILSIAPPGIHNLPGDVAVDAAKMTNDYLAKKISENPKRFRAFASLPMQNPEAAAKELERSVKDLNFVGGMIHGLTNSKFDDGKESWPVYETAAKLDVPIYLHPGMPHHEVRKTYYQDYTEEFALFQQAAWGYTVETATMAIRLVLSRVFEKIPNLKIILGHLGETLPFLLWRVNHNLKRPGNAPIEFREVFCNNFYVTTSGNFSDPALLCCMQEMGVDRILFAIDWPFIDNKLGADWFENISISREDKVKILNGNASRIFKL
ncbi:MAG: amidohydrolase [Flavobacteriaceae bacterium]|nr:amidohydrolase [Flavobacteriaceae bacterium]|tara:strand:+ start:8108 stop:9082 length:975 start_codon:yes stop_codon:yes gene_type:complete